MPRLNSNNELENLRKEVLSKKDPDKPCVAVCSGAACQSIYNQRILKAFEDEIAAQSLDARVDLRATGCHGFCQKGPNVLIYPEEICYMQVAPEDVPEIVSETLLGKKVVERLIYTDPDTGEKAAHMSEVPFYKNQTRNLISSNPKIDPTSIEDYLAIGGYSALSKALFEMTPERVLEEVKRANLRGRGGGGFPAGLKWETARNAPDDEKYVIVNGHEGLPGAFMDRAILTGNPHCILEGFIIGAYAIGSHRGFIYTRHDAPRLLANLHTALAQAEEYGLLGDNILGTDFTFHVEVHFDVGIFVSGESSALMRSIEGKNPEPRPKYIRTSVHGIWDKPSNLNNVETWANVARIIDKGAEWYTGIGTECSSGTKLLSLSGNIVNSGVVEVPFGTTLRQIINDIGGGIPNGKKFKAVQLGGPMGGCLPESFLDTPLDFDEMSKLEAPIGAGDVLVLDEDANMVELVKYYLTFLTNESCGKCVPCREGIKQLLKIVTRISEGTGKEGDIEMMEEISDVMRAASLCALGKTASDPLRSTLHHFREEYEAGINTGMEHAA